MSHQDLNLPIRMSAFHIKNVRFHKRYLCFRYVKVIKQSPRICDQTRSLTPTLDISQVKKRFCSSSPDEANTHFINVTVVEHDCNTTEYFVYFSLTHWVRKQLFLKIFYNFVRAYSLFSQMGLVISFFFFLQFHSFF